MSQFYQNFMSGAVAVRKVLEVQTVTTVIETGFLADTNNNFAFFDMAVTDDKKVWMGGASNELNCMTSRKPLPHRHYIIYRYVHLYVQQTGAVH